MGQKYSKMSIYGSIEVRFRPERGLQNDRIPLLNLFEVLCMKKISRTVLLNFESTNGHLSFLSFRPQSAGCKCLWSHHDGQKRRNACSAATVLACSCKTVKLQ